jgi:hypothetical protein
VDSWRAPQGIGRFHFSDEAGGLGADGWTAQPRPVGEPRPVLTEATTLPPQDSVGRHDDEGLPPAGPDSGQPDPQEAISRAQLRPGHRSPVHGRLLAKGQVFQGELTVAADEERQESKQVEQHGNHRARSSPYPRRQFKRLVAGRSIGEGQARELGPILAEPSRTGL